MCGPRSDVIHSGDGVLCLCHLEVSNSSSSGMAVCMYYCIVKALKRTASCDINAENIGPYLKRREGGQKDCRHAVFG